MPATPSPAQSEASRLNGASSAGPVTDAGKARASLNAVRHGLSGRSFFLLPDEDPEEFAAHEAELLATYRPRDHAEREAVLALVRATWREIRGDRLEAQVLGDLFAAGRIADQTAREAARAAAFRQLATVLRYQARIGRELTTLRAQLDALRQRRLGAQPPVRDEPEPAPPANDALVPDEPERPLNRQQRRALAAMARKRAA
ncbi:MAG: hypothetical protein AB7I59_13415 [Geminicoccaceae bacterium]